MSASEALTRNSGAVSRRSPSLRARLGHLSSRLGRGRYLALPLAALLLVVAVQAWPQAAAPASAPAPLAGGGGTDSLSDLTPAGELVAVAGVDTTDTDQRIAFWQERLRATPT
ncbi:MAG TPA: hypothetical protein VEX62_02305, partial [Candidatus Limnocylindrales bacterium]|nr:hypothetical protein [Candidatus Limnocylindrales bacterium]